jgi:GMP synthase (glutamine-hydrolysing)
MSDVWIVDFGSQYTQLITRKARELGYSSFIITYEDAVSKIQKQELPLAFILSGGPQSVFEDQSDYSIIFNTKKPVLGICYGMQIIGQYFGGTVERGHQGEYGHALVHAENNFNIKGVPNKFNVWMSHFDHVTKLPQGFSAILKSENGLLAGMENPSDKIMA